MWMPPINFGLGYRVGIACLLILFLATGCLPPPKPAVKIELDVFSGQPNPQWSLSAEDTTYLLAELEKLPETSLGNFDEPLGYRGILVSVTDGDLTTYRIWKGLVSKDIKGQVTVYQDDKHRLETWLLASGKPFLPTDLFDTIKQEIDER